MNEDDMGIDVEDEFSDEEELTLAEAARQYGYAPQTILLAIHRGSLPAHRGKVKIEVDAWFVSRQNLEEYIARAKDKGKGPGSTTRHRKGEQHE